MKNTISILMAFLFVHYSYAQTAVAPTAPVMPKSPDYTSCGTGSNSQTQICKQNLDQQYQVQLSNYSNALKNYQAQMAAASTSTPSALDAARSAEAANNQGKNSYQVTQMVTMVASMAAFAKAAACAPPPSPCKPIFIGIGIAMAGLSMLSGQQSGQHAAAQYSACTTANQLTTTPTNCGSAPAPYNPSTYPSLAQDGSSTMTPNNIVDSNGNCTASQDVCSRIAETLPAGANLKDYQRGLSAFASGKVPIKVNPDGTITNNLDGKKFDPASLNSVSGMVAAGIDPNTAKGLMAELSKNSGGLSAGDASAKSASGTGTASGNLGAFDDPAAAAARNGAIGFGVNGEANSGALDANGKNRSIASSAEGLVRDFNGENIGVQGDDIFKMMKRRYLLKDKQDSFMTSTAPATPGN